ncbi:MAG: type II secretion system F family protein [Oscillospiraceae bacterium]|nr:type II secretion system F family protein [Oscillospiraceae bacterium]
MRKLSSGDLSIFCLQLSLILKAGIQLHEGLMNLGDKTNKLVESKQKIRGMLGRIIDNMADMVELDETLSSAMKKSGGFPGYVVNMAEIGEQTGKLDNVLESLGDYYERDQYMKAKIRNSLMYPVFLFIVMSVVIALLVGKVFPIFRNMLESMGGSLSAGEEAAAAFTGSLMAGKL